MNRMLRHLQALGCALAVTAACFPAAAHAAQLRIHRVTLEAFDIPLKSAFTTAKGSSDSCYGILVTLHARESPSGRQLRGIGTILPRSLVSNEIRRDAWAGAHTLAHGVVDQTFEAFSVKANREQAQRIVARLDKLANDFNLTTKYPPPPGKQLRATLCGFDIALLDLLGQWHDLPICDLLDTDPLPPTILRSAPTFSTTDGPSRLSEKVAAAHKSYVAMRLKIGKDPQADTQRLIAVAETLVDAGREKTDIWVDVNQAWKTGETSIAHLEQIGAALAETGFNARFIVEQPTAEDDLPALAYVTRTVRSWGDRYGFTFVTMADEAVWTEPDAHEMVRLDAADMVNIKMQKAGGFFGSLAIADYLAARSPDTGVYLGGLVMTDLGAWANVHLAFAVPRLDLQTSGAPRRNFPVNVASFPIEYAHGRTLTRPTQSGLSTAANRNAFNPFITQTETIVPPAAG